MARCAFYSFHYDADNWRASQVRNMGVIAGNCPATDNDWESVKRGGDAAIQKWINNQLNGTSVAIVLIGNQTAGRKWINYEICQAWNTRKGVLGIHIHSLKDRWGQAAIKGANPFDGISIGGTSLSRLVRVHDPPFWDSSATYAHIQGNLANWIEEAIRIRAAN